ncbi:hypothetical protein ACJJTC_016061 [Scirpophaga incertulas]
MVNCGACGKFLSSVEAITVRLQLRAYVFRPYTAEDGACEEALHNKELAQYMAEMREFRKEMVQLRDALSARLDTIERRLDELEQRQPEAGSVTVLAARLGVTLEERDVVFAESVGPPPAEAGGRARRVVVRLARRNLRDELIQAARARRSFTGAAEGRIFINERLTRHNRQLFHLACEECRRLQWKYTWTRRGRILVRKADGSSVYQLRSKSDVEQVLGPRQS